MKQSERFALREWLSYFPDKTYDEIYAMLTDPEEQWKHPEIDVREVVEHHTLEQVADLIESTRIHFERMTEDLVSALQGAVRLAQENAPDMIDDEDFNERLNGLQVVLTEWETT